MSKNQEEVSMRYTNGKNINPDNCKKGDWVTITEYHMWTSECSSKCPDGLKYPITAKLLDFKVCLYDEDNEEKGQYTASKIRIDGEDYGITCDEYCRLATNEEIINAGGDPAGMYQIY